MKSRGFTAVELLIVIIVMAILLTLAVVNVRSSRVNARDDERKTDVANIATILDAGYDGVTVGGTRHAEYPGTDIIDTSGSLLTTRYSGLDPRILRAPGRDDAATISLVAATNDAREAATIAPQPTHDTYVYQPLDTNGALCAAGPCRSFTIYYLLENTNVVQMHRSRHQ